MNDGLWTAPVAILSVVLLAVPSLALERTIVIIPS